MQNHAPHSHAQDGLPLAIPDAILSLGILAFHTLLSRRSHDTRMNADGDCP